MPAEPINKSYLLTQYFVLWLLQFTGTQYSSLRSMTCTAPPNDNNIPNFHPNVFQYFDF